MRISGRSSAYISSYRAIRRGATTNTSSSDLLKVKKYSSKLKSTGSRTLKNSEAMTREARFAKLSASVANRRKYSMTSSSQVSELLKSKNEAAQKNYKTVTAGAEAFAADISKLSGDGKTTLFDKARSEDAETAAAAKKEITDIIKTAVKDYNSMMEGMNLSSDSMSKTHAKQLKSMIRVSGAALRKIGITQGSAGTLKINENTLDEADITKVEKLFVGKNSLGERLVQRSEAAGKNAEGRLAVQNLTETKDTTSVKSYNSSGTLAENNSTSGGLWNIQA